MEHLDKSVTSYPRNVQERYAEKGEIRVNLFQSTPGDNLVSMSQDDKRFLRMMELGTHKNQQGNREMSMPFCLPTTFMPNK